MSLLVEFTERVGGTANRRGIFEQPVEINADEIQSITERDGKSRIVMTNRHSYTVLHPKAEVHARIEQAEVQRAVAIRRAEARTPA